MSRLREITEDLVARRIRQDIDPFVSAIRAMLDDVIDPRPTRGALARALERFAGKRVERPWRKRGIVPV